MLKEAVPVGARLDARPHHEPADRQIVQFGEDRQRPAQRVERRRQLAHRHERLAADALQRWAGGGWGKGPNRYEKLIILTANENVTYAYVEKKLKLK